MSDCMAHLGNRCHKVDMDQDLLPLAEEFLVDIRAQNA